MGKGNHRYKSKAKGDNMFYQKIFLVLSLSLLIICGCGQKSEEKPQTKPDKKSVVAWQKPGINLVAELLDPDCKKISEMKIRFRIENNDDKEHTFVFLREPCGTLLETNGWLKNSETGDEKPFYSSLMRSPINLAVMNRDPIITLQPQCAFEIIVPMKSFIFSSLEDRVTLYEKKGKHSLHFEWKNNLGTKSFDHLNPPLEKEIWTGTLKSNTIEITLE